MLDRELAGVDVGKELRRYGVSQLWLFITVLVAVVALAELGRRATP